jgi:hypothetical protein
MSVRFFEKSGIQPEYLWSGYNWSCHVAKRRRDAQWEIIARVFTEAGGEPSPPFASLAEPFDASQITQESIVTAGKRSIQGLLPMRSELFITCINIFPIVILPSRNIARR